VGVLQSGTIFTQNALYSPKAQSGTYVLTTAFDDWCTNIFIKATADFYRPGDVDLEDMNKHIEVEVLA
jgi:hypothetical protein